VITEWGEDTRAHVFDAIDGVRREMTQLINERSASQGQRSESQDKAVVDALTAAKEAVSAALAAAALAVDKAEVNAEKWRDNANEWRAAMNDREVKFVDKEAAALMNSALTDRVNELQSKQDKQEGHASGLSAGWGYLVGAASTLGLVLGTIAVIRGK
jgi:hypothetical protein